MLETEAEIATRDAEEESVVAWISGSPLTQIPHDLYIPPDALKVFLEAFEGPLDLLLYLIKKQNLDILDIPIAKITEQYMEYIDVMREMRFELAAEYLLMAAMLAEIKSRLLLPRPENTEQVEDDPRAELVRRLQEYERFKQAAENLGNMPQVDCDFFLAEASFEMPATERPKLQIALKDMLMAFHEVLKRAKLNQHHFVTRDTLSVRERMSQVLDRINNNNATIAFVNLFSTHEGKMGVVVTFIALLELLRLSLVEITQAQAYAPIYVRAKRAE